MAEKAGQESELRWFIDPIDGTKSFIRGVPLYSVLIGLEIAGRVEAGVAYFPALDEMLSAGSGLGCRLNGRRVRVSQVEDFARGVMSFPDINNFAKHGRAEAFERCWRGRATSAPAGGTPTATCWLPTGGTS